MRHNMSPEARAESSERMRKLHADPEFAAAHAERARERMRRLNADPEFAAAHAERMRKLHADPEFAAKIRAGREAHRRACVYCGRIGNAMHLDGESIYACNNEHACERRILRAQESA